MELVLERRGQEDKTPHLQSSQGSLMITPPIDEDYWSYRVRFPGTAQAIVGFPKFGMIGVGFAQEENWNTNLPASAGVDAIFDHIIQNKGDDSISDEDVRKAIELVCEAAKEDGR